MVMVQRAPLDQWQAEPFVAPRDFIRNDAGILVRGFVQGETQPRMRIQTDRLEFGPGGSTVPDVVIQRGAGGILTLNTVGNQVVPDADNDTTLGTTSLRWSDVRAVLINGADYGLDNLWRMTEAERYPGYPKGWAVGSRGFVAGKAGPQDPSARPVFAVTEEWIEYKGYRITPELLDRLLEIAQQKVH